MPRSLKKGPYIDERLLAKVAKARQQNPANPPAVKTWARDCAIAPEMLGFTFLVHNGKDFIPVKIREEMVGHKLGEFSPTTKFHRHGGKMQREIEKKTGEAAVPAPAPAQSSSK